jgi:hypothetical protein
MSDTKYKKTEPTRDQLAPASSLDLSYPSELRRPPAEAMAVAQDSIVASGRRLLFSRTTGGAHEFLVDNTATGGGTQGKPDAVTWRRVGEARTEQAPGTALVVRFLAAPAGASEYFDALNWPLSGVGGESRVIVTWTNEDGQTATATAARTWLGEEDADGAEQQDPGAQWSQLQHFVVPVMRPPDVANDLAEAAKFSEWVTVDIVCEDKGGARVIHISVWEVPASHVNEHDDEETTYTGSSTSWETNRPQIEAADGATFEEHRYGIFRSMDVAARQSARVGPMVAQWTAYDERAAAPADADVTPKTTTSTTNVRISNGTNTTWNTNAVGWFVMGTGRAPENLPPRVSGASSIPVLCRVLARFAAAGTGTGTIRWQPTDRSWVELTLDRAVVGTTYGWFEVRGWIEASISSDDFWPCLQDFFRVTGAGTELEVRAWTVSYGDYPTGA